ncbi:MAG: alpha-L-fucosidase [Marinilabiliaceae bacterium]|jgi:alpha-L-fucosidase|nr:alpha-L-fucosidase [Marinilabiliaceae bacterium]
MRLLLLSAFISIWLLTSCGGPGINSISEEDNMEWWREARFGMFIHWGLYAIPAGEWEGNTNHAEWIRTTAQVPLERYNEFVNEFNPVEFNADAWVKMAKDAGMKYIVITSKHHDGFCLFDSEYTDFDVMSTPFKRDILKELSDACEKEGIKMCWYHSIMDWHHPDYLPRRNWEKNRSSEGAEYDRYIEYMKNQLGELTSGYGDIGVLWFDGEWESTWTHEMGVDLYDYVKGLQEGIIVNNRVDKGRQGMAGMTKEGEYRGDFGTPEQEIPETGLQGVDWETCMTMNNHWGYNKFDSNWKSVEDLIHKLVDIASKGGNFLLNVGPKADGTFPQESIDRLRAIGDWMNKYSESIYGSSASPFSGLEWGRCTSKKTGGNTRLYLHVFDAPESNVLLLPGMQNKVKDCFLLDSGEKLNYKRVGADIEVELPASLPDPYSSVIVLDIQGKPEVYDFPLIVPIMSKFVDSGRFGFDGIPDGVDVRFTADGSEPTSSSDIFSGDVRIVKETMVKAAYFVKGKRVSGISTRKFSDVEPAPALEAEISGKGLICRYYEGNWDKLPDFSALGVKSERTLASLSIEGKEASEYYGLTFEGYIKMPGDGIYTFSLSSDDGSRMILDGEVVISNDGLHSPLEVSYNAALAAGYHSIRVEYFQKTGGAELHLRVSGPGIDPDTDLSLLLFH